MTDYHKPIPVPSIESKAYWDGLRSHRLLMPECRNCEHRWFPPSQLCPRCRSDAVGWSQVSGRGKIFSYVVFHRVYDRSFADDVPYVVAIVELEEGPRLLSNIVGCDINMIKCEMPVHVEFEDIGCNMTIPKFVAAN
ncbi:MAG: Zn-ribbon domain-containing OB-fold protein [Hyphomicrobiales bacterium]|nr:Zn-ribbon domain-containing OB-fold protein [Hyphomicrobiales bacterium]